MNMSIESLYSETQCNMGNGHMGPPSPEWQSGPYTENITFP